MAKRSAASSVSATFSLAFGRSPGADGNSFTLREGSTRWRPRSRKTQRTSPYVGRFEAIDMASELGFATVFVMLALTMLFSAIWLGLTSPIGWSDRFAG